MKTREKLLKLLESNRGTYLSGEEIARELEVSRAAVWKAVKSLRSDGYSVDAATNRGYCLSSGTDILSAQGIQNFLEPSLQNLPLTVVPQTESTNIRVRQAGEDGYPEGFIFLAEQQTGGRGRNGRPFFSPGGTGIYMSVLLRPYSWPPRQATRITTMAAAAMCRAIEEVCGEKPGIKWVNDIFVRGRKVCGILTEGSFGLESGVLEYAVLGVGINVYPPREGFPPELENLAGAVLAAPGEGRMNRLAALFLNRFFEIYKAPDPADYVQAYRRYSLVIGKKVTVLSGGESRPAQVLDIDDQCRLLVRYESGEQAALSYGEIRILME